VKHKPTIKADLLLWDYTKYPQGCYDIVYASPQCTAFSKANHTPTAHAVTIATSVVSLVLDIMQYFNPTVWILENPVNRLQDDPVMQYRQTTSYCLFGTPFRKDTNIWSNIGVQLPRCADTDVCAFKRVWGFHEQSAQTGTNLLHNGAVIRGTPAWKAQQMLFELLEFLMRYLRVLR